MAGTFDEAALLESVDRDLAFLAEAVAMLRTDGRSLMEQIAAALAAGDAQTVGRAGHSLKGMVSNFRAAQAYNSALAMERLGKLGDLPAAAEEARALQGHLDALLKELDEFIEARRA